MGKSPDAFRTISEVSEWLDTPAHVLRFWESKFAQIRPVKRAGGRRYYRPEDMELLAGIKALLHDDGMTIKGVQKLLREKGVRHVAGLGQSLDSVPIHANTNDGFEDEDDTIDGFAVDVTDDSVEEVAPEPRRRRPAAPEPEREPDDARQTTFLFDEKVVPMQRPRPEPKGPLGRAAAGVPHPTPEADLPTRGRFFSMYLRTDRAKLSGRAAKLAPLIARLEAVRPRLPKG